MPVERPAAGAYRAVDPRTLGRPVHRIDRFVAQLRSAFGDLVETRLNRRYRARFRLGALELACDPPSSPGRWHAYADDTGRIDFAVSRELLLCILECRYGRGAASRSGDTQSGETATEERVARRLGEEFTAALASCIVDPSRTEERPVPSPEWREGTHAPLGDGAWTLRAELTEPEHAIEGQLVFRIDAHWMARVFAGLAPGQSRGTNPRRAAQPLPARLQLPVVARLVRREMSLGELLSLRPGDVIPADVATADVLVGDSRVMTATVAEHAGRLCLTGFDNVE